MKPWLAICCAIGTALGVLLSSAAAQRTPDKSKEYPTPMVREEQHVVLDGADEIWRLQWRSEPKTLCEPSDISLTCPCTGFAYGEGGDLDLIRLRESVEVDRFSLSPLFEEQFAGEGRVALIQRWQPEYDKDVKASAEPDFTQQVSKRQSVQVMHFADYDHDGQANEFYLQTEALPCGKSYGVVVGVSKANPRLHAFGTASKPDKPLFMQRAEWDALRDASGPVEVLEWPCGDHGADTQTTLQLRWTVGGIEGTRREFACGVDQGQLKLTLLRTEPL